MAGSRGKITKNPSTRGEALAEHAKAFEQQERNTLLSEDNFQRAVNALAGALQESQASPEQKAKLCDDFMQTTIQNVELWESNAETINKHVALIDFATGKDPQPFTEMFVKYLKENHNKLSSLPSEDLKAESNFGNIKGVCASPKENESTKTLHA